MARQAPVENTDYLNNEIEGVIDFSFLSTGGTSIQAVTEREFPNTPEGNVAYEAFMREPVVIRIHSTTNENEPFVADISLNGVPCPLPREVPLRIPRAFVEVVASSQIRAYRQERVGDPDASEGMRTKRTTGASFPFQVLQDKNPRGRAWLERITHSSV